MPLTLTQDAFIGKGAQPSTTMNPSSLTVAHTITAGARKMLFVGVMNPQNARAIDSVTWNGTGLSLLHNYEPGLTNVQRLAFYYIELSTLGSDQTHDIVVTMGAGNNARVGLISRSYTGFGSFGTVVEGSSATGPVSITLTSSTGEICADIVLMGNGTGGLVVDAGQTLDDGLETGDATYIISPSVNAGSASHEAGAASVGMGWDNSIGNRTFGQLGVPLIPGDATFISNITYL